MHHLNVIATEITGSLQVLLCDGASDIKGGPSLQRILAVPTENMQFIGRVSES